MTQTTIHPRLPGLMITSTGLADGKTPVVLT